MADPALRGPLRAKTAATHLPPSGGLKPHPPGSPANLPGSMASLRPPSGWTHPDPLRWPRGGECQHPGHPASSRPAATHSRQLEGASPILAAAWLWHRRRLPSRRLPRRRARRWRPEPGRPGEKGNTWEVRGGVAAGAGVGLEGNKGWRGTGGPGGDKRGWERQGENEGRVKKERAEKPERESLEQLSSERGRPGDLTAPSPFLRPLGPWKGPTSLTPEQTRPLCLREPPLRTSQSLAEERYCYILFQCVVLTIFLSGLWAEMKLPKGSYACGKPTTYGIDKGLFS